MKALRNLGHHERIIRIAIGLILLALSGFSIIPGWGDLLLMAGGLIALLTGIIGYCPAWHIVGINTCKVDHGHSTSTPKEELHEQAKATTPRS
jgi:hypothetical protein